MKWKVKAGVIVMNMLKVSCKYSSSSKRVLEILNIPRLCYGLACFCFCTKMVMV